MKVIKIILYILAMALLITASLGAQMIQLQMDPNPSPYLSDWEFIRDTAILIVTNDTDDELEAKISSQLFRGTSDLIAETKSQDMMVQYFPVGVSTYFPEDLVPVDAIKIHDTNIEESVIRSGMIPADTYTLCINLVDPYDNTPLLDEPACQTFVLTDYQPPTLIQPFDQMEINISQLNTLNFSWTSVMPNPEGLVTYKFQIFEVLEGQSLSEAFQANYAIVEEYLNGMTQYILQPFTLDAEVGKRYVWIVQALDSQERPLGEPEGRSELFSFNIIGDGMDQDEDKVLKIVRDLDPKPAGELIVLGQKYLLMKPSSKDEFEHEALMMSKLAPGSNPGSRPDVRQVDVEKEVFKQDFGPVQGSRNRSASPPATGILYYVSMDSENLSIDNPMYNDNQMNGENPIYEGSTENSSNPLYEANNSQNENPLYEEEGISNDGDGAIDWQEIELPFSIENPLAKESGWQESTASDRSGTKSNVGPIRWMAPESLRGGKKGYDYYQANSDMSASSLNDESSGNNDSSNSRVPITIAHQGRLISIGNQKQVYDSDGNGRDDCYAQIILYPDGVYSSLTSEDNPSYLHINFIGEEVILFGDSGTDDTANKGTQVAPLGDITITNSSSSDIVLVQVGTYDVMRFSKKYITCPIIIIANLYSKQANTQSVTLSLVGDTSDITIIEYARSKNYDELICSQLSNSNIYYGINDYSTTLIHAYVQVFDIGDSSKRIGFLEGTFETYIS